MTKSEAPVSKTGAVIFPPEFVQDSREKVSVEQEESSAKFVTERQSVGTGVEIRFARLRKSVRKRSANIL
jgi:hypothetical protein